ncbi:MAG: flagellar protein FlgN [Nitrospirae bacterium]|jgi:hypothetical protein|nr:flagellar protein FlgN [Nitrospirota bacterium]
MHFIEMTTLENIKSILIEQINGYRFLLELLQKERLYLLNFDAQGVEAVSKEKDVAIIRLRLIEEERIRLINKYLSENNLRCEFTLQKLIELTGDNNLSILRMQLISLMQSIEELNSFNMILIGRSLNFVRHSMAFLESVGIDIDQLYKGAIFSKEI